ncbi:MAG: hypothetical protein JWR38_2419 [Mucilaginibacter sp.]|nr:hypothetical protein [Mucilaginibacter sp.]
MKRIFNHIHRLSLGMVLTLTVYRGETIADTCLNYCFDRLFYVLNKIEKGPDTIRQMTGVTCIVFFILLNLTAYHVHARNKTSRLQSALTTVKLNKGFLRFSVLLKL